MQKKLALLLAAFFMAVSVQTVRAEDEDADDAPEIVLQADDDADADDAHPLSLGHPGHWRGFRGHGPQMMPGHRGFDGKRGMRGRMGMGHRGDRAFGFFGMPMMRDIDLSDAQKTQMIDAMVDVYRQRLVLRMEQDKAYQLLKKEYESDGQPNRDTIVQLNKALGELKGKLEVTGHEYHDKIQSILTADQKDMIKKRMEEIEKKREERGPRGKGPRNPKTMRGPGPQMQQ